MHDFQRSVPFQGAMASLLFLGVLFGPARVASAATFTYTGPATSTSTSATPDSWSAATNWKTAPVAGSTTSLTFSITNTTATVDYTKDDIAGNFQLNALNLNGSGPTTASTTNSITITGNPLEFTGTAPTITLGATHGSAATEETVYTVDNNLVLDATTTLGGNGTGIFNFGGAISGSGGLTMAAGSAVNVSLVDTGVISDFNWTGNITVTTGVLGFGAAAGVASDLFTMGGLNIAGGTFGLSGTNGDGNLSVSSLTGSGTLYLPRTLTVNYVGSTTDTFSGTFGTNGTGNSTDVMILSGSGNLALTNANGFANSRGYLINDGTGTLTMTGATGATGSSGIGIADSVGEIVLTGTSGVVGGSGGVNTAGMSPAVSHWNGAYGNAYFGGILSIDPALVNSSTVITVTADTSSAGSSDLEGALTLQLNADGNSSLNYDLGSITTTGDAWIVDNSTSYYGALTIAPAGGWSSLGAGTATGAVNLIDLVAVPADLKYNQNGIAPGIFVANNDADQSGDFAVYVGTGIASDQGFVALGTYGSGYLTSFTGSTNTSVVELTGTTSATIAANTTVDAIRLDTGTITIDSGDTLTFQNTSSTGSNPYYETELILNGGMITGRGGLIGLGASDLMVYVSGANGTINNPMSGTGNIFGAAASNPVSLTKIGPGTLFLGSTSTYTGETVVDQGALDASTNAAAIASTSTIVLNGGVLEGNGTFNRNVNSSEVYVGGVETNDAGFGGGIWLATVPGGGFAAYGGSYTIDLNGYNGTPTAATTLAWGTVSGTSATLGESPFLTDTALLMFGAATADDQVIFENNIDLGDEGLAEGTGNSAQGGGTYYRTIYVTAGTGGDSAEISGNISSTDAHGLLKAGNGTLILSGNNTYSGLTQVSAGKLMITGQTSGQGAYTVNTGATLGGAGGTIGTANANITVASGAYLSVSNGGIPIAETTALTPGTLTLNLGNGTLDLSQAVTATSANLIFVLSTTGASDEIKLGAGSTLNIGTGLSFGSFVFDATGSFTGGTYVLFDTSSTSGAILGTLGTSLTGTVDGVTGTISISSDGNGDQDIVLTTMAVPEPGTVGLLGLGAACVLVAARRRSRRTAIA